MKKWCAICLFILIYSQIFSSESSLRGMNGISQNGNNFIPDFWADTLMVNPAFAVYLKAKWGFYINNSLHINYYGNANDLNDTVTNDIKFRIGGEPMFLYNFSKFIFGIGGNGNFGFNYHEANGNMETNPYINAGVNVLFSFNITDAFKFGIEGKFISNLNESLSLSGVVTPGVLFLHKKNTLSLTFPTYLTYINKEDLNGKFKFGIIFTDDFKITEKLTVRFPAKAEVKLYTAPEKCYVSVPFSAGVSVIGKVREPLILFAGLDLGTSFGNASVIIDTDKEESVAANRENYFGFTLTPTLNAGIEATVLSWFVLRTGVSHYFCRNIYAHYNETKSEKEYWENSFELISGINWTAGCTFTVGKAVKIDLAAQLQNLDAVFLSRSHAVSGYEYTNTFEILLTAAVSLFSN